MITRGCAEPQSNCTQYPSRYALQVMEDLLVQDAEAEFRGPEQGEKSSRHGRTLRPQWRQPGKLDRVVRAQILIFVRVLD